VSFGAAAFGLAPFGAAALEPGPTVSLADALASGDVVYLLEIDGAPAASADAPAGFGALPFGLAPFGAPDPTWSEAPAAEAPIRFSDAIFISQGDDTPAHTWWEPRLVQPLRVSRGFGLTPGAAVDGAAAGEAELDNADGGLDGLVLGTAIDGRRAQVLVGRRGDPRAAFSPAFTGVCDGWQVRESTVGVALRDPSYLLDVALRTDLYAGTGGLEGGADLGGTAKPLRLGGLENEEPRLVDPAALIWQVSAAVGAIPAVYDRGAAVTAAGDTGDLYAGSTTGGQFRTDLARGLFQLGSSPSGRITCDVEGDATGSGYVERPGSLLLRVLREKAGLDERYVDEGSFLSLDTLGPVGLTVGEGETARQVLSRVLAGLGGGWTTRRDGRVRAWRLAEPDGGAAVARLDARHILALTDATAPADAWPPNWRRRVTYRALGVVQPGEDLAGSVSDARREFLARPSSSAAAAQPAIVNRHLRATDPEPVASPFREAADAAALAAQLLALHGAERLWLSAELPLRIGQPIEAGDTVIVAWPRRGLAGGRAMRAWPVDEDAAARTIGLLLWG